MKRSRALPWAAALLLRASLVQAEPPHTLLDETGVVMADLDDDDEDGVLDAEQPKPPEADLWRVPVPKAATLSVEGPIALIVDGARVTGSVSVAAGARVVLQGLGPGPATLRVRAPALHEHVMTVAAHAFLDGRGRALDPRREALGVSRHITHDRALPRGQGDVLTSEDPDNVRLAFTLPGSTDPVLFARLEAHDEAGSVRVLRHVPLQRAGDGRHLSPFLRLVSDSTDESAPEVSGQLLRVGLRDRVEAVVRLSTSELGASQRVGRPGRDGGPRAALRGRMRMTVLRSAPGGAPVLGADDAEAVSLARSQVEIANEIWAQCFVSFGPPAQTEVRISDPPPPALLAVADIDGLPARGGGSVMFRANGGRIGPIATRSGAQPGSTARDIARALVARGFSPEVTINPRTEMGAGSGADVVVRDGRGALVTLSVDPGAPLSSDAQQRIEIGMVNLLDGIQEFDNSLAATGTLEERTLLKLLIDQDPTTIDVLLINHFVNRDRQGEAFIEADGSSMANVLVFDRNAVRYDRQAWVQAHELGHVLLDEAFHPDSIGPDEPWLLMDADAQRGRVTGPKRLRPEDCARVRRRSGPSAHPPLLAPAP